MAVDAKYPARRESRCDSVSDGEGMAHRSDRKTCQRLALHMVLDVGDIQFMNNEDLFHARTEYKDHPLPAPGRHLLRLWLATPESEGGWKLPFHDSDWKKRGGVQVDDRPAKVLFHPE